MQSVLHRRLLRLLLLGGGLVGAVSGWAADAVKPVPRYGYEVVATRPHDEAAFTQGLFFHAGRFYESTGQRGHSWLREVDFDTGAVRRQVDLPATFFGEGAVALGDTIYQLTWRAGRGFCYDVETFERTGEFAYAGEGWGLTTDGQALVMSDGTPVIRFLDTRDFQVQRTIEVRYQGRPVPRLNELEWVEGEIWANIWQATQVVRIDPADGRVIGVIEFDGLLPAEQRGPRTDVLNGIAYDPRTRRVVVTGKYWPRLFVVELRPKE